MEANPAAEANNSNQANDTLKKRVRAAKRELTETEANQIAPLLLLSDKPLSAEQLAGILNPGRPPAIANVEAELKRMRGKNISKQLAGMELVEVAQGWRWQVSLGDADLVQRLYNEKPPRYSRAVLETLAIIAWRGPVTRGDIESIRGVAVSPLIIRTLMDREWIIVKGHRETLGRPELLVTTDQFLNDFNLKSLNDLPEATALFEPDADQASAKADSQALHQGLGLYPEDEDGSDADNDDDNAEAKASDQSSEADDISEHSLN